LLFDNNKKESYFVFLKHRKRG